jgi:hypothetical protein
MIRSRHRIAASCVVILAMLRFLVPVGYMPMIDGGRLTFMICDGSGWAAGAAAHAHHHHLEHSGGPHSGRPDCSYAQSASPALVSAPPPPPYAATERMVALESARLHLISARLQRHTHARGPPALA